MLNILCLDNNYQDVKMIESHLKNTFDYELLHLFTEDEFKKALDYFKPDLILSDYRLAKGFDGLKALKIRNKENKQIPFIVVTTSVDAEQAARLIKNGATDLITKNHLHTLPKAITNALKQLLYSKEQIVEKEKTEEFEALYTTLVENDISGVYIEKGDTVIYANPRLLNIFGFSSVEELNKFKSINLYVKPEDRSRLYEELTKKGKVTDFSVTMRTKQGDIIHVLENATAKKNNNNEITVVYGYIYDISKIKESEEIFKSITNYTDAGIAIYDKGKFLYVNSQMTSLTGYSREELLKMTHTDLIHPEHYELAKRNVNLRVKGDAQNSEYEYKIVTKNGKIKWVHVIGGKFPYKGKETAIVTVYDITNRKRAEDELMTQNRRNKTLLRILEKSKRDINSFLDYALHELIEFLGAQMGYIYFYDEETETFTLNTWNEDILKECPGSKKGSVCTLKDAGWWGEAVFQRKPVLVNDFKNNTLLKKKHQKEDITLFNYLSIPVYENHKIVAVAGVANKENGFSKDDIRQMRLIMDAVWKEVQLIKANLAIKERELNFKDIVENSPFGVVIAEPNGDIVYANDFFCKLTGYSFKELSSLNSFNELTLPEERLLYKERMKKRFAGAPHKRIYERIILTKSGKKVVTEFYTTTTLWRGKKMLMVLVRDLTEQRKSEETIRMLQLAIEQVPVSIVITDLAGDIEYVNPFFTQLTGYSEEEVIGQNPRILQSGKTDKTIYPKLWDTILSGKTWEGEFINRKKNGEDYIERALITPVVNRTGEIVRFIAVKEDITLQKEYINGLIDAKEKAEAAERLKTNFLANVSHELRTPLNGILGFSDLLESENLPEAIRTMIGYIKTSSLRLLNTLNLIIDYSVLNADRITVKKKRFDLIGILKTIKNNYEPLAGHKNLFFYFNPEIADLMIISDKSIIEKAVSNIVDNAIKFTSKGGVSINLDTSVFEEKRIIRINVRDTGIGIPKEYYKVIFEPFRQISEGYGRNYEGMGLGLSISKKYIEALGGNISLTSVPGKGSVFIIEFPAEKAKDNGKYIASTVVDIQSKTKNSKTVLCFCKDSGTSRIIEEVLSRGYNYHSVTSHDQWKQLINSRKFDLIIADIDHNDNRKELSVLNELNKSSFNKTTPRIAITAVRPGNKNKEEQKIFNAYLLKPVSSEELLKTTEWLLNR